MKTVIFSDVHGNLPALEKMLGAENNVDLFISLGDVVNYGPWSNECVDLLESLPAVKLMGNHEENFLAQSYPGANVLVQTFFKQCIAQFDRYEQIRNYKVEYRVGDFTCVHTLNNAYIFPDTALDISGKFFIGHSHHQFDRRGENFHVVNVGSVGQNRKEINVINYVVFDPESGKLELKSLTYDVGQVIQKMKELKYPQACVDYYQNKPRRS